MESERQVQVLLRRIPYIYIYIHVYFFIRFRQSCQKPWRHTLFPRFMRGFTSFEKVYQAIPRTHPCEICTESCGRHHEKLNRAARIKQASSWTGHFCFQVPYRVKQQAHSIEKTLKTHNTVSESINKNRQISPHTNKNTNSNTNNLWKKQQD